MALGLGVAAAIVIAALTFGDRLPVAAADLRVGDCFDPPAALSGVIAVQRRPCNEQHGAEMFFVADHLDEGTYPGVPAFENFAMDGCVPAFESYVGRDYETDRELGFTILYPDEEAWDANDHEVACFVHRLDEQPLTKSVKATSG